MTALLTNSSILGSRAAKKLDGSIALRRWFVKYDTQRRLTLIKCGFVSKRQITHAIGHTHNPNVFTIGWKDCNTNRGCLG